MANTTLILDFLKKLKKNNTREWVVENQAAYKEARAEFTGLAQEILVKLQQNFEGFENLQAKDCIFRQNRDVRFSPDKTPYTTWMSAWFSPGGKKAPEAGYYFRIEPENKSVLGAGHYMPPLDQLKKIRQEIDYNAVELKQLVDNADFKNEFGLIQGEKLKRAPKGYEPHHPQIELLKLKNFIVMKKLKDKEISQGQQLAEDIFKAYRIAEPFVEYLNVAVS